MWELVGRLEVDYPDLRFREGQRFCFRPSRTIIFVAEGGEFDDEAKDQNREQVVEVRERGQVAGVSEQGQVAGVSEQGRERAEQNSNRLQLLHEVGHALLEHKNFKLDLERLKMERAAWEKARELCAQYDVWYDEEFVEGELDTYRDWLHRRSRCPRCGMTRYQNQDGRYHCPVCEGLG